MITPRKIFIGFLSFILFIFLIYSSYIYKKNMSNFSVPKVINIENPIQYINNNKLNEKNSWDDLRIDFLNYSDKIISYSWSIEKKEENINLEKWNFLVDIWDLNSSYKISGEWFVVNNNWPASFYIDNSKRKTLIYSINNILKIDLIDPKTWDKVNTLYLYPNEYIAFSPSINKIVRSADILRISQVFSLNYINDSIFENFKINKPWSEKILFWQEKEKLEEMFLYLINEKLKDEKTLKKYITEKKISINWEAFIEKYFYLFLNTEKKRFYYKNIALRELGKILSYRNINTKSSDYLLESLEKLKDISENDYNEIKNIVLYYLSIAVKWNKNTENKIEISKILNKVKQKKYNFEKDNILKLYKVFSDYNFYSKKELYKWVNSFTKKYLEYKINSQEKWYLIFFLSNFILSSFKNINYWEDINLDYLMSIIDNYTEISIDFYKSIDTKDKQKRKKIIETWIKTYNEILKKLKEEVRKTYFKKELWENNILIRKYEIEEDKIKSLKYSIKKIFKFFKENKNNLDNSSINEIIKKEFEKTYKTLNIYFEALLDYDKYEINNNKIYKNLIWEEDLFNQKRLDINDLKKYLSKFNHIDISNSKFYIRSSDYCYNPNKIDKWNDEFCFEIKNMILSGNIKLDFLLYPSLWNKIEHISINWDKQKNTGSYPLDELEINYKEKLLTKKDENPEIYKFENFFLYTFNPQEKRKNKDIYISENNDSSNENAIIRSIKSNSLLWKNWSLAVVSNYLDIKYNNIIMNEKPDKTGFDINLKNIALDYKLWEKNYYGIFNSEYIFKKWRISSFKNPSITFIDSNEQKLLNGNSIIITWLFPLKSFKEDLEKVIKNFENISKIVDIIYNSTYEYDLDIKYSKNSNTVFIKSDTLYIAIKWNILSKILYKWKNLLTNKDKIDNLSKYLNNLK